VILFWLLKASTACQVSAIGEWIFLSLPAYTLRATIPSVTSHSPMRPPITLYSWYRNINRFSIAYPFRTQLRTRLTLHWRASCRNPWVFGEGDSTPFLATHACMLTLTAPLLLTDIASTLIRTLSTTWIRTRLQLGAILSPGNFRGQKSAGQGAGTLLKGGRLKANPPGDKNSKSFH